MPPIVTEQEIAAARQPHVALWQYVLNARPAVIATAFLLYACLGPFVVLDFFITLYQAVCFPIFGIPKVSREGYFVFDRGRLTYLNLLQRLNCRYCSYANGLLSYVTEIAARTEQHWCPIQHERHPKATHSRYTRFLPYGDSREYRKYGEDARHDFADLDSSRRNSPPCQK